MSSTAPQVSAEERQELTRKGRNPDLPPNHPINALSPMRKFLCLATLSYAGLLSNFWVAIIMVAFVPMGKAFGVSPGDIPNTIGYALLGLAVGPLVWNPLSRTIGRRPVYLIGSLIFIPTMVWLAESNSYGVFSAGRFVAGFLNAWANTVPPATVADMYVPQVRGAKMSSYIVCVVISPAIAPLFSGLIVDKHSWRILFWFMLALAGLQFFLFFFFVPETMWIEDAPGSPVEPVSETKEVQGSQHVEVAAHSHPVTGHVGKAWMPWERPGEYFRIFMSPILMMRYLAITLPSIYYGMLFAWSVGITIVAPQKFEKPPYSFATIPLGCSFLAYGIGGLLGKWSGGIVGDKTVSHFERKNGNRQPEDRLWALLPLLPLFLVGCIMVGVCVDKQLHWAVLLVGGGIYFFAMSAATGILQTYVLETYLEKSMDTMFVFGFFKLIWGFAIPFFGYEWGTKSGFLNSYAVQGALSVGVGFILCVGLIWKGRALRMAQGMPEFSI